MSKIWEKPGIYTYDIESGNKIPLSSSNTTTLNNNNKTVVETSHSLLNHWGEATTKYNRLS